MTKTRPVDELRTMLGDNDLVERTAAELVGRKHPAQTETEHRAAIRFACYDVRACFAALIRALEP